MNELFLSKFHESFPDLESLVERKKYYLLIPDKGLIQKEYLTKTFYLNHIYWVSPYNQSLYINLNGKVLKYDHPKFISFLGWKENMELTVKENYNLSNGIKCFQVDNLCDDINYTKKAVKAKETNIKDFNTSEEYIKYYSNFNLFADKFKELREKLHRFSKDMKYNYMFLKGFEDNYSKIYKDKFQSFQKKFKEVLSPSNAGGRENNFSEGQSTNDRIASELVESLFFTETYSHIFNSKLTNFYKDEENELKSKLKENPIKYEWEGLKVDPVFKKCQFNLAISILDNINKVKTVFEKIKVIKDVNQLFMQEAQGVYNQEKGKPFQNQTDYLITFWTYVIAHAKAKNIIAESEFIRLFGQEGFDETQLIVTTFLTAIKTITNEILGEKPSLSQYTDPNFLEIKDKDR